MAFKHGTKSKLYWHDTDLTDYLESIEMELTRGAGEARPLGRGRVVRARSRLRDLRLTLQGLYEGVVAAPFAWDRLNEDTLRPFSYLPHGDSFGGISYSGLNTLGSKATTAGDDVLRMPLAVLGSDDHDRARILCPLDTKTTDGEGATYDSGAATTNGGVGYLHCTALDPLATALVTIDHSPDEIDWYPLVEFDLLTTAGSQALAVSGVVYQYLRATWELTGNATIFVAFGRR